MHSLWAVCVVSTLVLAARVACAKDAASPARPDTPPATYAQADGPAPPAPPGEASSEELRERGRAIYARLGCKSCHSIGGEGNTRHPLGGVAARLTPEQIRTWIVAPKEMNPTVRKPRYDLTPEELDALVRYLEATAPPSSP